VNFLHAYKCITRASKWESAILGKLATANSFMERPGSQRLVPSGEEHYLKQLSLRWGDSLRLVRFLLTFALQTLLIYLPLYWALVEARQPAGSSGGPAE
jgi:hypothetical protein